VSLPKEGLSLRTPIATVTGSFEEWSVHLTVPDGEATLMLHPVGGVLYNAGAGSFPFFGTPVFHYALPTLETAGTVVANDGQTYQVSGVTWFDRQWENMGNVNLLSSEAPWSLA
jgi:predicted secreted hydrolase